MGCFVLCWDDKQIVHLKNDNNENGKRKQIHYTFQNTVQFHLNSYFVLENTTYKRYLQHLKQCVITTMNKMHKFQSS